MSDESPAICSCINTQTSIDCIIGAGNSMFEVAPAGACSVVLLPLAFYFERCLSAMDTARIKTMYMSPHSAMIAH